MAKRWHTLHRRRQRANRRDREQTWGYIPQWDYDDDLDDDYDRYYEEHFDGDYYEPDECDDWDDDEEPETWGY